VGERGGERASRSKPKLRKISGPPAHALCVGLNFFISSIDIRVPHGTARFWRWRRRWRRGDGLRHRRLGRERDRRLEFRHTDASGGSVAFGGQRRRGTTPAAGNGSAGYSTVRSATGGRERSRRRGTRPLRLPLLICVPLPLLLLICLKTTTQYSSLDLS
jgi:hypothetical protein